MFWSKKNDEQDKVDKKIGHNRKLLEIDCANALKEYELFASRYNMPAQCSTVKGHVRQAYNCWISQNTYLCIQTSRDTLQSNIESEIALLEYYDGTSTLLWNTAILIQNIKYYQIEGEVYSETKVSGGGGGGSSLAGAVIGGVIAGGAGAIIGSRRDVEPITSKTIRHNNRCIVIHYCDGNDTAHMEVSRLSSEAYPILFSLLPQKEYKYVISQQPVVSALSVTDKIRELAKLKDDGILTEEEFVAKKTEMLKQI